MLSNGVFNELCVVVGLKAPDDALVVQLHMSSEVGPIVFNADHLQAAGRDMSGKIVLEQKDFAFLTDKLPVPFCKNSRGLSLPHAVFKCIRS